MNKLFNVIVGESCDCHYLNYCPHGPYINSVVRAESAEQIRNIMGLHATRYDVHVKEQTTIDLDQLAAEADDLKDRFA